MCEGVSSRKYNAHGPDDGGLRDGGGSWDRSRHYLVVVVVVVISVGECLVM